MSREDSEICFAKWAQLYRRKGFWPRPIKPGTKACKVSAWQRPDDAISESELRNWLTNYASYGIGLLMGSPFPDGTTLGALDIDHDDYVRVGEAILRNPQCMRKGKKGVAIFVRVQGKLPSHPKFEVAGKGAEWRGAVAECLFQKTLCVIPPTQHPETGQPYVWLGPSLLEIDFANLPVIGI